MSQQWCLGASFFYPQLKKRKAEGVVGEEVGGLLARLPVPQTCRCKSHAQHSRNRHLQGPANHSSSRDLFQVFQVFQEEIQAFQELAAHFKIISRGFKRCQEFQEHISRWANNAQVNQLQTFLMCLAVDHHWSISLFLPSQTLCAAWQNNVNLKRHLHLHTEGTRVCHQTGP